MPVVLISTISESGTPNLGPYSLCFPHIIADEGKYAMMLISRSTSNTAQNIRRTKLCSINFIPDDKKYLKNCVMLGYPGETTEEKMKNSIFTLLPSMRDDKEDGVQYPKIVEEAVQVFECTWDDSFNNKLSEEADNFVLRINNILLKEKYYNGIIRGMDAKNFPRLPIDHGFRDNVFFWFQRYSKPIAEPIPKEKGQSVNTVLYQAKRYDPDIIWMEEACAKIVKVPRIFLKKVIAGCVDEAKKAGITTITPEFMDKIRDKRNKEK